MLPQHISQRIHLATSLGKTTIVALLLSACTTTPSNISDQTRLAAEPSGNWDELMVVDCMLRGQVRELGKYAVYQAPGRVIKTTARDCKIRGGEYVAFDRSDYKTALRTLLPKARAGDPVAQTYTGEIYEKGLGVPSDHDRAAQWYRKAAEQGYSQAQINLGFLYEKGLGVSKEPIKALNWYRQATGLTEDEITFKSYLEEERQALREEIELREGIITSLRQALQNTRRRLENRSEKLENLQQELEEARRQLQETTKETTSTPGTSVGSGKVQTLEHRVEELQTQLEQARQEKSSLQQNFEQQKERLTAQLRDAQSKAESLQKEVHALEQQLVKSRDQLKEQQLAQERLKEEIEHLKQSGQEQARSEIENLQKKLYEQERQMNDLKTEINQLEKLKASREEQYDRVQRLTVALG